MSSTGVVEGPNVLHHVSGLPDAAWTRVNAAEALPGLLTPLGWTFWDARVELALRGAFADMGVLQEREVVVPATMDERFTAVFYGRFTGNLDKLRACADRTPGTSASALEEQMFGSVRPGVQDAPTRARYPAIAVKLPRAAATVRRRLDRARADTDAWWRHRTTVSAPRDEREARAVLGEAAERFRSVFRVHLLNSFMCQAAYEQLTALAADAGRPGLELRLASGFGGMEESRLVSDLWEVSRDRMTLQAFVADHGYHGFSEGDIARRSWREDPGALTPSIASYRAQAEDRSPAEIDRARREDRRRAEAELADSPKGGRVAALRARAVLGLAGRHIPLREVGKVCFLQAIDVGRCAARVLGETMAARGALEQAEDVYFVTFDELIADAPGDLGERVSERRAIHQRYAQIEIPQAWVGTPEPTEVATMTVKTAFVELSGLPIFPGVVEGRAVVVSDPATAQFEPGDVLVCEFTDPSWAMLMTLAGALVIDIGGAMSHGAIVARELGIPTVISTVDGSRRLRTGDRVRVDAGTGTVRLLERAPREKALT